MKPVSPGVAGLGEPVLAGVGRRLRLDSPVRWVGPADLDPLALVAGLRGLIRRLTVP